MITINNLSSGMTMLSFTAIHFKVELNMLVKRSPWLYIPDPQTT